MTSPLWVLLAWVASAQAYWLMGIENFITTERMDPVVNPGKVSGHVHSVLGGSNFRFNTNTEALRQSECTSIPIPEDKSSYWFPHLYFQWANGSFTSLNGGAVIYYLFSDTPGTTTAFPDNFRMLSGDPTLRTYDPNNYAQQAITFLCLDFNGVSSRHNELPVKSCPSGIRAQINFPSCWDGKNLDSPDHKSHVAFLSGGPDSGTCSDPKYPVTIPRIFIEVYWASNEFEQMKSHAMNPSQPFVYAYGDPTGYGYHADFINGWDKGVLQNAVDKCHCNAYGDPTCCVEQGIFHMNKGQSCRITKSINEQTTGTLSKLPGNNPVQPGGRRATMYPDTTSPQLLSPVYAYTGDAPALVGSIIPGTGDSPPATTSASASSSSVLSVPSSSAPVPVPSSSGSVPIPSSSTPVHVPSSSAYVPVPSSSKPVPSHSSASTPQQSEPSSPETSTSSIVVPSETSTAQSTSTQAPTSASTTVVHTHGSSTSSYAHTIPATTKNPFPTFSIPSISISIPSFPIPTFSFPHIPGVGNIPQVPSGNGNVHVGAGSPTTTPSSDCDEDEDDDTGVDAPVSSGHDGSGNTSNGNGNTHTGTSSSSGSTPHYYNTPEVHTPVPNGHEGSSVINTNRPLTDSGSGSDDHSGGPSSSSSNAKPRRCPNRKRNRRTLLERESLSEAVSPVEGHAQLLGRQVVRRHSHHRRHSMRSFMDW